MLRTSFRFAGFDIPSGAACSCLAFAPLGAPRPRFGATVTMTLQNCALGSLQGGPPPIYALSAAPGGLPITARQPWMFHVIFGGPLSCTSLIQIGMPSCRERVCRDV